MTTFSSPVHRFRNLAAAVAITCVAALPGYGEDFSRVGQHADWILACPESGMTRAIPRKATTGNCHRIKSAVASGNAPQNQGEAMSPTVGTAVLDAIDPVHSYLKGQGFREPKLFSSRPGTPVEYRVTVAPQAVIDGENTSDQSYGFYSGGFLYIGVESHLKQDGSIDTPELEATVAHEYFHAMQAAYLPTLGRSTGGGTKATGQKVEASKDNKWLIEGTAEYFAQFHKARVNGKAYDWNEHSFDFTKSLLKHDDGGYDHHLFFAMLARIINGRGTTEAGMKGFGLSTTGPGYLAKAFAGYQDGPDGLTPDKDAMRWFAAAIPDADPQGRSFQRLYTLVMRDLTYAPDYPDKIFQFMPGKAVTPERLSLRGRVGPGWTQTSDKVEIEPIATKFYRIDASKFPEPGRLGVEIIVPDGSPTKPEDLHLSIHGVSYSAPNVPGSHNFGVIEKGEDEIYLSVSNIAALEYETQKASFEIRLSWLSGGFCDYESIYASTRIDQQISAAQDIGIPPEFYSAFYPPPSAFLEEYGTRRRDNSLAGDPAILPDTGRLIIRGGNIAMGGDACTHHVGGNSLIEAGLLGDSMGFSAETEAEQMARDLRYVEGGAKHLTRTQKTKEVKRLLEIMKRVTGGTPLGTDARDASVVLSVFSPDLYPFYHGIPAITEAGPMIRGRGGWDPNSSGAVNIILPGIKLRDLEEGRSYPAVTLAPEGGASDAMPIAGVWRGVWEKEGPIGDFSTLSAGRLTGVVKITEMTSAQVKGTFQLRGKGSERSYKAVLEKMDTGDTLRVEEELSIAAVPVSVSGSFSAPTAETGTVIFKHIFGLRSISRSKELE